jgi:hypothetical protein
MDHALSREVVAERLDWQRQQKGPFFGEQSRDLLFRRAVDAGVGPMLSQ